MNDDAIKSLMAELHAAFPPWPLEVEAVFQRWGGTYLDAASFRAAVRGKRWDELSPDLLELHREALLFLGPESVTEVLPAYLVAVLQGGPALDMLPDFVLLVPTREPDDARFDARFRDLAPAQRRAITRVLETWERAAEGTYARPRITAALDSAWR